MRVLLPVALVLTLATHARAQEPDPRSLGLPRSAVLHIERVMADSETRRYHGDAEIAANEAVAVPVMMTDGVLRLAGTLRNELIVWRGDVVFEPGAVVEGDVTVVSGRVLGQDNARIGGSLTVYGGGFDIAGGSERFERSRHRWDSEWRWHGGGDADFTVQVADNYNRVEGLPVQFGPDIRTGGAYATRLQALAVWRTELGPVTQSRHMGYVARLEQFLGGETFRVGAAVHSLIQPIESWSLTDVEASIAAAVFHDDQRDYFERRGWSAYARLTPAGTPLDLRVEYRNEDHRSVPVRDPWTLFNSDRAWRAQPRVGEGDVRLVRGSIGWDARRGEGFSTRGWLVNAEVTQALGGTLKVARADGPALDDVAADFTAGLVDLRRYERAGRGGIFGVRIMAGGSLEERALPPQYQHALGGAGSLPGFPLFSGDCGARRSITIHEDGDVFFPSYGCDRFALAQIEYRGGFNFRLGPDRREGRRNGDERRARHRHWTVESDINWTIFFDAGRGWALQRDVVAGRDNTPNLYDVGAGVILGGVGIYGAVPLDDSERALRLFVRLGPRF
jgi:hypothetical protein